MRIAVTPEVIEWALQRSCRQEKLEQKFTKIGEWLAGTVQPTFRQLQEFAKAAAIPFGYLLLDAPPTEHFPIANYRTLTNGQERQFSPELIDTIQLMQRRQAWMRDYLISEGHGRLSFVGSDRPNGDPIIIAQHIRHTIGIDEEWAQREPSWKEALKTMIQQVENAGILVMSNGIVENNTHRKLDPSEFRGFVLTDDYAPLVFLNGADGKAARMFTLAHELAHIWLGASAAFDLENLQPANNVIERACNLIAAEFLVPSNVLRGIWPQLSRKDNPCQLLAKRLKVCEIVAARRLLDLELISRDEFFRFYNAWQANELRLSHKAADDEGGGNFYASQNIRIGHRFGDLLTRSVESGTTLYSEAWRLTNLKKDTFQEYAKQIFGRSV